MTSPSRLRPNKRQCFLSDSGSLPGFCLLDSWIIMLLDYSPVEFILWNSSCWDYFLLLVSQSISLETYSWSIKLILRFELYSCVLQLGPVSVFYKILNPLYKTQKKLILPFFNVSYLSFNPQYANNNATDGRRQSTHHPYARATLHFEVLMFPPS